MSTSDLPPNPSGTPTPAGSGRGDFTTTVELRCVMTPTGELKRAIPLTIVTFLFAGFVALVVIGIALNPPAPVAFGGAVVVGAIVAGFAYLRTWSRLRRVYGEQQRLLLTPQGLRRTDGTLLIDMPWASILRLEERNSALSTRKAGVIAGPAGMVANAGIAASQRKIAVGIVGHAVITPLPDARRAELRAHDRLNGGLSNLAGGQPFSSDSGLVFPAEFEENWSQGTIGAWLRHYRPDLGLPN